VNFRRNAKPAEAEMTLNIVALTDIAFLIVIFFMFSTHFSRTQAKPMDLPKEAGEPASETVAASELIIEIDKDGGLAVQGSGKATLEQVLAAAKGSAIGGRNQTFTGEIIIRADQHAAALHLNILAAELAKMGVKNWKLATSGPGS